MNRILSAGIAGLLLALTATSVAAASPVTLRVEGSKGTLVPDTVVDPAAVGDLTRNGGTCKGTNTAAGALQLATNGDWDGTNYSFGVSVDTIKSEKWDFSSARYWGLYVNGASAPLGACDQVVQAGDDVVFAATCQTATTECYSGGGLTATAPATARPGQAFPVTVKQTVTTYDSNYNQINTTTPAPGASVGGATTGADGIAQVTVAQRGAVTLRVTRQQQVPDAISLCITDGADGFCGTTAPDGTTLPPEIGGTPPAEAVLGVSATAAPDRSAPKVGITGVKEGQRFSRKTAPRVLRAAVSDPSGVLQVKLALTRQVGKKCFWFSGSRERFVRSKCGKRPRFKLSGTGDVDYLLPGRLKKGRYVFDVLAVDKRYNRDELARGRNRVVFVVR